MSHEALISPIREWLIDKALGNSDIVELFETLCLRISAVGIPVTRARLFWPTLHPLFQAETVSWNKGSPASLEQFEHQDTATEMWMESPLKYVVDNDLDVFRRELTGPNELIDFSLIKELKELGYTDFVAMETRLEGTSFFVREEGSRGILVTWTTDSAGGFSNEDLISLQKIQRRFAVACKVLIQTRISFNIASTYLGDRAAGSVLSGQIRRGDGQTTNAVVWYSDMRQSTHLAETMPPEAYFDLLNSYFMATAQPVTDHGGEVLDFIGDAVLAIFPYSTQKELKLAAKSANLAIADSLASAEKNNNERKQLGLRQFNFGIGLNIGKVMFGNIGIPSRLTFSVIGPAVNEAARIEAMTKVLKHSVLADEKFAKLSPKQWKSLGKHKLDGVKNSTELFGLSPADTL